MTERKWTAGPWVADISDPSDVVVFGANSEFIGNVAGSRIQSVSVVFDVDIANANLIAAAPDLYEALQGVVDWFDINEIDEPRLFEARAALAKARGEQNDQ